MDKLRRGACVLSTAILMAMPAAAQPAQTVLSGVPATEAHSRLVNALMDKGFHVTSESPSMIVFEKAADNLGAMFLFGTRANAVPVSRVSFSLAEVSGSTRVMADLAIVSNPGTAFERRNSMNQGADLHDVQALLDSLAAPRPAGPPIRPNVTARDGKLVLSGEGE